MEYKKIYLARRNPAISLADWPQTWRSHAIFASRFPALGAEITSLNYCARWPDPEGLLHANRFSLSQAFDGVAVVSSPAAQSLGGHLSPNDRAQIEEDELRVFDAHTSSFSFDCREVLVQGTQHGNAAIFAFLARRWDCPREDFAKQWNDSSGELAVKAASARGITCYVHNRLTADPPHGYPFDGIVEIWFADVEDAVRQLGDPRFLALTRGPGTLVDQSLSVALLTTAIHRWPRC